MIPWASIISTHSTRRVTHTTDSVTQQISITAPWLLLAPAIIAASHWSRW